MQSLSLTMRPTKLEEVIGHAKVVTAIREKIAKDVIPTGFLFSGPPGVGKTTLAQIVARDIQGELLPGDEENLDIRVINAADLNGVDAVRDLVEGCYGVPFVGRFKVRILDEAHQFTVQAQNVFLNPMEMAESSVIWIFTTTDPQKLLPALKSRCLHFALKPMGPHEAEVLARKASEAAGVAFDPQFMTAVDRFGLSSPRDILMAYDKFLAGVPVNQLVDDPEKDPLYADLAKALLDGNWDLLTDYLNQVKTPDARALRAVVSAFLKSALLKSEFGSAKADAMSNCLLGMAQYNTFEDGVAYALTTAVFYRCCKQIRGAKA